ncbi:MAG: cytochrome c3 family protein [Pseudomonadota bacterium]
MRSIPRVTIVLSLLAVVATARADEAKPFSHKFHLEEAGAACTDCHQADPAKKSGMGLNAESCSNCHDPAPVYVLQPRHRRLDVAFPHLAHVDKAKLECLACHGDMPVDSIVAGKPVLTQERCVACHAENKVSVAENQCVRCHGVDQKREKPTDHQKTWLARHGTESRWRVFDEHGQQCQLCHGERACQTCHLSRLPRDHNGLWRTRMHGSAASWDRDRCKTCHETGTCVSCHRSAAPVSHRGDWRHLHGRVAGGFDSNCTVCHQPSRCVSCHRREQ